MRAEDIQPADMKRLLNAVFKQAVKDYVKLVATGEDRINGIGTRKEIERYFDTGMASAGTHMHVPTVKKKLMNMTQQEAAGYLKAVKCDRPSKGEFAR